MHLQGLPQQPAAPFTDGVFERSASDSAVEVVNPSTGRPCGSIPAGCEEDVNRAVASARRAAIDGRWSSESPSFRKSVLDRFADMIDAAAKPLDAADAEEMGKPISERLFNAAAAATRVRFCAEAVDKINGCVFPSDRNSFAVQRRVPRGVVAAITPWNFPTFNAVLKVAPALAAGNCVVLKPSELASRSAASLVQMAVEAGLPAGVLNLVPGLGETVGRSLALHSDVDMVTFTGSTDVGKSIFQCAGRSNLKVVMAECGGKSPQIVFDDGVDLHGAAEAIARFLVTNQGQICSVGSRLLVERSIEKVMVDRIVERVQQVSMGNALDPRTTFGPLASQKQCARVMQYIAGAKAGAEIVAGGRRVLEETGGLFVEPTVFRNVSPAARIAQEEIFGPVLSVIPFDDEQDAIRIANGTIYGLSAYVWTANLARALRMMKAIGSSVRVNATVPVGEGPGHAYSSEPARESGVGAEGGLPGIESYLRRQMVWFNHA